MRIRKAFYGLLYVKRVNSYANRPTGISMSVLLTLYGGEFIENGYTTLYNMEYDFLDWIWVLKTLDSKITTSK